MLKHSLFLKQFLQQTYLQFQQNHCLSPSLIVIVCVTNTAFEIILYRLFLLESKYNTFIFLSTQKQLKISILQIKLHYLILQFQQHHCLSPSVIVIVCVTNTAFEIILYPLFLR